MKLSENNKVAYLVEAEKLRNDLHNIHIELLKELSNNVWRPYNFDGMWACFDLYKAHLKRYLTIIKA